MVHFPAYRWFTSLRIPSVHYVFMHRMDVIQTSGLPHSDIPGSWDTGSSPGLFAAGHVLLRLAAPRHPPWTLISLDHIVFLVPFANRFQKSSLEARGFEPLTLGLQSRCSSQLSYAPVGLRAHDEQGEKGEAEALEAFLRIGGSFPHRTTSCRVAGEL